MHESAADLEWLREFLEPGFEPTDARPDVRVCVELNPSVYLLVIVGVVGWGRTIVSVVSVGM
jgi:hypothetical protein